MTACVIAKTRLPSLPRAVWQRDCLHLLWIHGLAAHGPPVDEVDPAISPLDLELQAGDHPMPGLKRLVDIGGAVRLWPARPERELGLSPAPRDRDASLGKAGRDRRAELPDRDRIGLDLGDRR